MLVVTSRPAGVRAERYVTHFHHLTLCPLDEEQQERVIEQRLKSRFGAAACAEVAEYVREQVPFDETGRRATGNPLMLFVAPRAQPSGPARLVHYGGPDDRAPLWAAGRW